MLQRITEWRRPLNLAGFAACALLLGAAYYYELVEGMEPCPLCVFQRLAVLAVGIFFLAAAVHGPAGHRAARVYGTFLGLAAGIGVALAARHLWLQSLPPDQVPACGPGLDYMLDMFPLWDAVRMVLQGSGECAEVDRVLGLSMPVWTLGAFLLLGLGGFAVNWARGEGRPRTT